MKNKIKIILFILLMLLIAILISLKFLSKSQEQKNEIQTNKELRAEKTEEYFSDKVLPQGVSTLYGKYNGDNEKNDLYRSIASILNYLPKISDTLKTASVEEVSQYYLANELQIEKYFGIDTIEDFNELVESLKSHVINNDKYKYCSIDSSTYEDNDEYLTFNLNIVYENTDTVILKVYFANSTTTKPKVIFLSQ